MMYQSTDHGSDVNILFRTVAHKCHGKTLQEQQSENFHGKVLKKLQKVTNISADITARAFVNAKAKVLENNRAKSFAKPRQNFLQTSQHNFLQTSQQKFLQTLQQMFFQTSGQKS